MTRERFEIQEPFSVCHFSFVTCHFKGTLRVTSWFVFPGWVVKSDPRNYTNLTNKRQ